MDIEHFRRMDPKEADEADIKAREIKQKYFNKKYFFGPNSPATRDGLDNVSSVKYHAAWLLVDRVKQYAQSLMLRAYGHQNLAPSPPCLRRICPDPMPK